MIFTEIFKKRKFDLREPQREVQVGPDKLEVVATFCYLGDMLSAAGGCELSTTTRVKTAWKKFKELKPVLSSRHLSFKTSGRVYSSCVWSAMLHASETWPVTKSCLKHLQRNDRAMIRQICNVKPQDTAIIRSTELLACLGIEDLDLILKKRRLRWFGHMDGSILICHPKFLRGHKKRKPAILIAKLKNMHSYCFDSDFWSQCACTI